jgi:hypothetical protein
MISTAWMKRNGPVHVFRITCPCGADTSAFVEGETLDEGGTLASAAVCRAWSAFLHDARARTCKKCLAAGGAWLRAERARVS